MYNRTIADYPPSQGWTLKLHLTRLSATHVDATDDGTSFIVTLLASVTAGLAAGLYNWIERVKKGAEEHDVAMGRVTITPNLATATGSQEWVESALELVRLAISGKLTDAMDSCQIGGRAISLMSGPDLFSAEANLAARLIQLKTGTFTQPVRITFGPL